jgi:hypothetical protein
MVEAGAPYAKHPMRCKAALPLRGEAGHKAES